MSELNQLPQSGTTYVGSESEPDDTRSRSMERKVSAFVLLVIAIFTFFDLLEDRLDGAPWGHIVAEAFVVLIAVTLAGYLFRRSRLPLVRKNLALERQLVQARADAVRWKQESAQFLRGLSAAISHQLAEWGLSEAERDIAMLLLKGLSHKEIAGLRNTSERTVRQQAATLYQKSGLAGRAELSAFFLEDLLSLSPNEK